ncbi:N-acetylglucosamine-6-phosphate deacetylase [Alginatibacterium sediminis]|uniref:N-acetylgalactosamine-6-phosphate deacetylase n=1 Tax=Alginatibacterium sediminis TaxID=2164068 RepID=A0A420EI00_9ALTE|nr:N-acetylglucosamine-6-phosphate deacetylase [Alginatibacterium sediminis]RKF20298.1 N-acetylglucosamine-6-phosphate deacetylase [Alginatibacterium sediminis]
MRPYALVNGLVFDEKAFHTDLAVVVRGQHIERVDKRQKIDPGMERIDVQRKYIVPGFIDLQLNGCGGVMLNGDFSHQTLDHMHATNLKSGTTSFLPTLITTSDQEMEQAVAVIKDYQSSDHTRTLGLHLEGPYLSLEKKGIHSDKYIRELKQQRLEFLLENHTHICKVTLAPENVNPTMIKQLSEAGILVSLGHTNAGFDVASTAIKAGAGFATHLFNAMSMMSGREPGVLGAIFDSETIHAGIIADGHHVNAANMRISKKMLGERLCLVTDATAAAGSDISSFDFVGKTIQVKDGICFGADGTLGGSAITMMGSIKHCVQKVGFTLEESLRMASLYPARAIKQKQLGEVKAGYRANLNIIDAQHRVLQSISDGKLVDHDVS